MLTQRGPSVTRPAARFEKLVVTESGDEVLLYDTDKHHIHHLNATTAAVWRLCDGKHTVVDLAREAGQALDAEVDEATVRLALTKLDDAGLLKESLVDELRMSRMSRRSFMQRAGIAGAIAVPAIVSTTSHAFAEWSQTTCTKPCEGDNDCLFPNEEQGDCAFCVLGFCRNEPPAKGCGALCDGNPSPCSSPCSVCGGPGQPQGHISCCNPATVDETDPCTKPGNQWNCAFIADGNINGWDVNGWPAVYNCGGQPIAPLAAGRMSVESAEDAEVVVETEAAVSVSPGEGAPGAAISISFAGFEVGEPVQVTWDATGSVLGVGTAESGLAANVPQGATAGWNDITATGLNSGLSASSGVTVLAPESVATETQTATATETQTPPPTEAPGTEVPPTETQTPPPTEVPGTEVPAGNSGQTVNLNGVDNSQGAAGGQAGAGTEVPTQEPTDTETEPAG